MTVSNSKPWHQFDNRCDRCGAESWVRFERLVSFNEIETHVQDFYLCGHHGNLHRSALTEAGYTVDDYSHLIGLDTAGVAA